MHNFSYIMESILGKLFLIFGGTLWAIFVYYFVMSACAWIKRKETPASNFSPIHKFAVLIAAHNEENVIANIIESLHKLNYPKELYDVFVIADNCTDKTACIARKNGAKVYERTDNIRRGKGHSLEWMFKKLFEMDVKYDAVCVLDADNLVSSNFLMEMNKHLCMGHKVVQGYLDSKNPSDTWISSNNSIAFWITNRLFQLPRYYMNMSCILGGTGFIISMDVLKEIGWGATCLVEDLEFTLKLVLRGMKVYWAHDAVIYDEKPLTLKQSIRQRKRWMQGHFDCARRFFKAMIIKAFKEKSIIALDFALHLTQPVITLLNSVVLVLGVLGFIFNQFIPANVEAVAGGYANAGQYTLNTFFMSILSILLLYLSVFYIILEGKLSLKIIKYLALMPIYNLTWVPAIIQGFRDRNKKEWIHTLHTRSVNIDDIEVMEKVG